MSKVCQLASPSLRPRASPRCTRICSNPSNEPYQVPHARNNFTFSRRQGLVATIGEAAIAGLFLGFPDAASAGNVNLKYFNPVQDQGDNYRFLYPFGWQEVSVEGEDVVYKDLIEPLESVSVTITPTERGDISEFGTPEEVAQTLAENVLTPPSQKVKVLGSEAKQVAGRNYYVFEFASVATNYIRQAISVVCVYDDKFYTLTTGANERRWKKMEDKLKVVAKSFQVGVY